MTLPVRQIFGNQHQKQLSMLLRMLYLQKVQIFTNIVSLQLTSMGMKITTIGDTEKMTLFRIMLPQLGLNLKMNGGDSNQTVQT